MTEELMHIGMPRRSGRYPWGSGDRPFQSEEHFLAAVRAYKDEGLEESDIALTLGMNFNQYFLTTYKAYQKSGMSDTDIAKQMGISSTKFRDRRTIALAEQTAADISYAQSLRARNWSYTAIGEKMGVSEGTIRYMLEDSRKDRVNILYNTSKILEDSVKDGQIVQVGLGVESRLGVTKEKLRASLSYLQDKGYNVYPIKVSQLGGKDKTTVKVLAPPDVSVADVYKRLDEITIPGGYTENHGRTAFNIKPPKNIDSKRIEVRYGDEGGSDKDGVIELRRGVADLDLGTSRYAQVRMAVDGTHFLKGMAVYADDLPDGVDIRFNTNKLSTGNKKDVMKVMKDDPDNPFGASIKRQREYFDPKTGKNELSVLNILDEEGDWDTWSVTLASQMLSKQKPDLIKKQLDLAYKNLADDYDEITGYTNSVVREYLLEKFANTCDSASVHLKAAALPRQRTQVLLPLTSLKENEVYAPNFNDGEDVVLIRYPHGGIFEIPELVVNNKNRDGRRIIGSDAQDAVGINPKTASILSGADFDGDTVLVIPNKQHGVKIQTSPSLKGLENFDPKERYKGYPGMPVLSEANKQDKMGDVTNLITDMTIKGANDDEIAKAVRHSMVVIDAVNHKLNYKLSYEDNSIAALKRRYQGGANKGASTLISQAKSPLYVNERRLRKASEGGPVDPETGKKQFIETGRTYVDKHGVEVPNKTRTTKMAEVDDAYELSSGTVRENMYANYANQVKALANTARKEAYSTSHYKASPSAKKAYANEVASLNSKLSLALQNKPLEKQAQILGNAVVRAKIKEDPSIRDDPDRMKKVKNQALSAARYRVGSINKERIIDITPNEWEAIQAHAVSQSTLKEILNNTNMETVRQYATPKERPTMTNAKIARAKAMAKSGFTQAEIAATLGVSVTTINNAIRS